MESTRIETGKQNNAEATFSSLSRLRVKMKNAFEMDNKTNMTKKEQTRKSCLAFRSRNSSNSSGGSNGGSADQSGCLRFPSHRNYGNSRQCLLMAYPIVGVLATAR